MLGGDEGGDMAGDGRAADGHGSNGPRSERRRAVDAAVVALRHAVGGAGGGARYLKHVDQWVARLDPSASKHVQHSARSESAVIGNQPGRNSNGPSGALGYDGCLSSDPVQDRQLRCSGTVTAGTPTNNYRE